MARTGTSPLRILGIDPGLNITGYAAVDIAAGGQTIVEAGTIRTTATTPLPERITQLHAELAEVLADLQPDTAAVEQLYAHYKHPRTAILMGHARGVILLACQQAGVGVRHVSATNVKKSLTGNGHATKRQMQLAIQGAFGLDGPPEPADVADALAIALCASRRVKQ